EIEALTSPDLMQMAVERLGLETSYVEKQFLRSVELYHNSPVEMRLVADTPTKGFAFTLSNIGEGRVRLDEFVVGPDEMEGTVEGFLGDTLTTPVGRLCIIPTTIEDFKHDIRISWSNSMSVAKRIGQRLTVSLSGKESTVLVFSLNDTYPLRAESIINNLLDIYNEVWINNKNRAAKKTSQFINERLVIIEKELGGIEVELKTYKEKNNLTDIKAVAQAYLEESSDYAKKAFEVNNQLSIAQYIKDYLNDPRNIHTLIPANLGLQSSSVDKQIGDYNNLVLQRDRLLVSSGENNPVVADMHTAMLSIRTAILRSIDNLISTLQLEASQIEGQENQILARMASNTGQEFELLTMQRQQKLKEELYLFLLQRREENELASLVNVGNTRVIMNPNGSSSPVSPNKMMVLLISIILGFGIPFGLIFLMRMLDNTVRDKKDFSAIATPFLAEIPLLSKKHKLKFIKIKRSKKKDEYSSVVVLPGKRDTMNEAFRVLRTNIDLVLGKKKGAKIIMNTSFNPGAGKTFTLMNLAASVALKDAKVIVIDGDLRKGTLGHSLGLKHNDFGLTAYLSGRIPDWHKVVHKLDYGFDLIPVGTIPPNPTELILKDDFAKLLEELSAEYDYIFIDCPPVDVVADSSIVTQYVDMTILVTRAGLLDKRMVPVIDSLYKSKKYNHLSILLNGVDFGSRRYSYGYSYGYGKGYSYGNENK
ncbi:MAG: GumC family protein, partial [Candidatus Cryptobacteroides sp.]